MQKSLIPMFPLALLPMPGELVPLHIFEPRYKELLHDAEATDISFGIYFSHEMNEARLGSLMKLESVIKRYESGESDIIVKCTDIFYLDTLYRVYKSKLYPGGDVRKWDINMNSFPDETLYNTFINYLEQRNISPHFTAYSLYQIANELSFDLHDRYKFLTSLPEKREGFLMNRLRFQMHLLNQEEKSKDVFHLN
jgi:hypothetical protein